MTLSTATLTANLADAETAYHNLLTGKMALVVVDQNGERVEYNRASVARLGAYIEDLKRQLASSGTRGPLQPWLM